MNLNQFVFDLNRVASEKFCSQEAKDGLDRFRHDNPTLILSFECMDGRVDFPTSADMPVGSVQRFRHIGGVFDLGSDNLRFHVSETVHRATDEGHRVIAVCTYHFSAGSDGRGCAGHGNDTVAAKAGAIRLREQFRRIFEATDQLVFPIVVGIETDTDAFLFFSDDGACLSVGAYSGEKELAAGIVRLYGGLDREILSSVLRMAVGNFRHIQEVRAVGRTDDDCGHTEGMICVGRGFGWFQERRNGALIIGPYDDDFIRAIGVAAGIVLSNMRKGKVSSERALLLTSSPFFTSGYDERMAVENSLYLSGLAADVIRSAVPELSFDQLRCVTDMRTRLMHEISSE